MSFSREDQSWQPRRLPLPRPAVQRRGVLVEASGRSVHDKLSRILQCPDLPTDRSFSRHKFRWQTADLERTRENRARRVDLAAPRSSPRIEPGTYRAEDLSETRSYQKGHYTMRF